MSNGNFDPAPGDGMFTTFSKYGLLGCAVGVIALLALRSQKADSESHAAAMGQLSGALDKLYVVLDKANDRAAESEEKSRVERKDIMTMLLGVKTEAAAAKTTAATLKADVARVEEVGKKTMAAVKNLEPE